jgi:hypothetical protein
MAAPLNSDKGVPVRLYYKIDDEYTANAEVVARASLAFIAGVRELAHVLDPSFTVQIGIEGYADGSLWEDLLLLWGKGNDEYHKHPKRYQLALAALAWIMAPPVERIRDNWWEPYLDIYFPDASDAEKNEVKKVVELSASGKIASREKQQFYREIARDTGINGVGANIERMKPPLVVPRADFPLYSGQAPVIDSTLDRTTVGPMRVIILSPVLEISNRRWKFATALGEFGAAVRDKEFLGRIVEGRTSVRMRGGVELDVQLETRERLVDGVWSIIERNVLKVDDIIEPAASRQTELFPKDGDNH